MALPKAALQWWDEWFRKNPKSRISTDDLEKYRLKCITDHAFLAKTLGYNDFIPEVHGEVWDFYVKKDPAIPFKQFALADKSTHDRALFIPRNCFKSTSNMIDMVQWIICWPNIRILLVTSTEDLGKKFLTEVQSHFRRQDDGDPRLIDGKPSFFQLLFPEFCIEGKNPITTFTVPCRTEVNMKEATVESCGVETAQSGVRCDVLIFDDAVSNENSNNPARLLKVRSQMSFHRKLMNPDGYCSVIGTWYNPQDAYGVMIRAEEDNHTLVWDKSHRSCDSRDIEDKKCITKIMLRPAMWEKGDVEIDINGTLREDDWKLYFPQRVHWKWLMGEYRRDPENFHSQLMNNPNQARSVRFQRVVMERQTRVFSQIPAVHNGQGLLVQAWDTAYSDRTMANYTVGLTALILGGRFYFLDMVRGQFSDLEVSRVMAESMSKWRPHRVVFEDTNGVRWLTNEIYREMERMNCRVQIELAQLAQNKKNRKSILAAPVAKMFGEGRIILSNGIPTLDKLYDELEGFQTSAPNDDIVDAMSLAVNYFQYTPEASAAALKTDMQEEVQARRQRSLYNHVYGLNTGNGGFADWSEQRSAEEIPSYVTYSPMDAFK
jgi:predicted phage terminase large subunit-like protein